MMLGLAWRPDSSSVVYGSSRGSTLPYPAKPVGSATDGARLLTRSRRPNMARPTNRTSTSPARRREADAHAVRSLEVSVRTECDGRQRPRRRAAVTHQTGQVLTPTAAPDGDQIAFLSDSGGHSNLWVISGPEGRAAADHLRAGSRGLDRPPVWSPEGDAIAFVSSKGRTGLDFGVWAVNADGSEPSEPGGDRSWNGVGPGRQVDVLRGHVRRRVEESPAVRRTTSHGAGGAHAQRHRHGRSRRCTSRSNARSSTGGRSSRSAPPRPRTVRPVVVARISRVACAELADRQSVSLAGRTVVGADAHRWLHDERLGDLDRDPASCGR